MSFDWEDGDGEATGEEHTGITGELKWQDSEEAEAEERTGVTGMLNWQGEEGDDLGELDDDQSYGFAWQRGQEFEELLDAVEAASYTSSDPDEEPDSSGFEWATGDDDSFEASEPPRINLSRYLVRYWAAGFLREGQARYQRIVQ